MTSDKRLNDIAVSIPLFLMLVSWTIGFWHWFDYHDPVILLFFGYIGLFIGVGIGGYIALPGRDRPHGRRLVMLLMGSLLLAVALITDHGNMQMEGLFFALVIGAGPYIVIHYLIAKLVGPLAIGRVWCGWACWYGMIFDLLPYPYSRFRYKMGWGRFRYIHFGLGLLVVLVLWYGFGFDGAEGVSGMQWFVVGLMAYYAVGIAMALALRDNRAFCKYLCPIAVPLKFVSRFSVLKVAPISSEHCDTCEACVEMCPMNIRGKDYVLAGERVLSTECTLCQTCINICPHDQLTLSLKLDVGGKEFYDYEPPKKRR